MLEALSNLFGRRKPQTSEPLPLTVIGKKPRMLNGFIVVDWSTLHEISVPETESSEDQQPFTSACDTQPSGGVCGFNGVSFTVNASLDSQDQNKDESEVFQCVDNLKKDNSNELLIKKQCSFCTECSVLHETATEK
ncbi:uncharacterized protein LOC143233970 isoform X2 [Tachypleus tridentatus]